MYTSFHVDSCHELTVSAQRDDPASAPYVVLNVLHTPVPRPVPPEGLPEGCCILGGNKLGGTGQLNYYQPPTETVISWCLKPSHARAIASAILSAATDAK